MKFKHTFVSAVFGLFSATAALALPVDDVYIRCKGASKTCTGECAGENGIVQAQDFFFKFNEKDQSAEYNTEKGGVWDPVCNLSQFGELSPYEGCKIKVIPGGVFGNIPENNSRIFVFVIDRTSGKALFASIDKRTLSSYAFSGQCVPGMPKSYDRAQNKF